MQLLLFLHSLGLYLCEGGFHGGFFFPHGGKKLLTVPILLGKEGEQVINFCNRTLDVVVLLPDLGQTLHHRPEISL